MQTFAITPCPPSFHQKTGWLLHILRQRVNPLFFSKHSHISSFLYAGKRLTHEQCIICVDDHSKIILTNDYIMKRAIKLVTWQMSKGINSWQKLEQVILDKFLSGDQSSCQRHLRVIRAPLSRSFSKFLFYLCLRKIHFAFNLAQEICNRRQSIMSVKFAATRWIKTVQNFYLHYMSDVYICVNFFEHKN